MGSHKLLVKKVICLIWKTHLGLGFPDGSVAKNPPAMQEISFDPWVRKIPWRRKWKATPVFLLEKSQVGYSP